MRKTTALVEIDIELLNPDAHHYDTSQQSIRRALWDRVPILDRLHEARGSSPAVKILGLLRTDGRRVATTD